MSYIYVNKCCIFVTLNKNKQKKNVGRFAIIHNAVDFSTLIGHAVLHYFCKTVRLEHSQSIILVVPSIIISTLILISRFYSNRAHALGLTKGVSSDLQRFMKFIRAGKHSGQESGGRK